MVCLFSIAFNFNLSNLNLSKHINRKTHLKRKEISSHTTMTGIVQEIESLSDEQKDLLSYYEKPAKADTKNNRSLGEKDVRHHVRTHVWSNTKFLTGEGSKRAKNCIPEFGKSHERPDLTKSGEDIGYPYVVLKSGGHENSTLEQKAEYWKQWENIVRHEIQVKRANVMKKVKDTLTESR